MPTDPRALQIASLSALLAYGMLRLDFGVPWPRVAVLVVTALGAQYAFTRLAGLARFDPKSALISSLSLCLLLRTGSLGLAAAAAFVTIASKFLIRARGKHVFNPVNFGLVGMLLVSDAVWVSPGQWGSPALLAFLVACLGLVVVNRAARSDVTFAFLLAYGGLLAARALWLGDPWRIPLHQLTSGALLIFAFFMISDPKTTPDSRAGRLLFAAAVALAAAYVQFVVYRPNPLLWALVVCSPLVPLVDRLLPGWRYEWATAGRAAAAPAKPGASLAREAHA
jgi:enediyne biosynthesis protein E5